MASYLLLRNNKESGPYSLEGLIQLGLKPYDLVWVEGRSAAWRYPSEVEDLKFYAPAVEEQPFDRFFKKPSELKAEEEKKQQVAEQTFAKNKTTLKDPEVKIVSDVVKEVHKPVEIEINKTVDGEEIKLPRKQVYVSMPANSGKTVFIKKKEQVEAGNSDAAVKSLYANGINEKYKEEPVKKTEPLIANSYSPSYAELVSDYNKNQPAAKKNDGTSHNPPADDEYPLEKKFSQSLDDIKDMYVQTLADRKRKHAQRKVIMTVVKRVVPFAAVLLIGVFMGVFIMNKNSGKTGVSPNQPANNTGAIDKNAANTTGAVKPTETTGNGQQVSPANQPAQKTTTDQNVADKNVAVKTDESSAKSAVGQPDARQNNETTNAKKTAKKDNKPNNTTDNKTALVQPKSVETDAVTGERSKVVRTADTDNSNTQFSAAKQFSNSLMKQVSIQSNDYKRGTFGGIHDLQLTVNNTSNYLLDNVMVELQYLKPNDQPFKTDNIRFSPVPPNGSLTLAIPPTSRGVKIAYKIIHVESKSAGNDTAGLK
jgi:hypothetical protein